MESLSFHEARRAYKLLKAHDLLSEVDPQEYRDVKDFHRDNGVTDTCARCGWERGEKGYLRMPFPIGHAYFGKAVKCPRCWNGQVQSSALPF
jgi:hypothetical protein